MATFRIRGIFTYYLDAYATATSNTVSIWLVSSPINNWFQVVIPFLDPL